MVAQNNFRKDKKPSKDALSELNAPPKKFNISAWLVSLLIAMLTFFVLSPSLKCDFVNLDDAEYVTENTMIIQNELPVKKIFTTPVSLNYHPLTILSFALNYRLNKFSPFG